MLRRVVRFGIRVNSGKVGLGVFFFATRQLKQAVLAFGPQHPAAHGILKLQLILSGEVIRWLDPQFGLLHRGTEKLFESRNLLQSLPYFDRFDYVANLFQEHAFCRAVESLHAYRTSLSAQVSLARGVFDELSRVLNHLLTLGATSLDLSAMGPIFWAFEERENILELCEQASGARMHTALYRPYAFDFSVFTTSFTQELAFFLTRCARSVAGAFLGLLNNRVLKTRLASVGQVTKAKIQLYGLTGIIARSGGVLTARLGQATGSGVRADTTTRTFLGRRGDNLDRFLIRVKETAEAFRALTQLLGQLSPTRLSGLRTPGPRLSSWVGTHGLMRLSTSLGFWGYKLVSGEGRLSTLGRVTRNFTLPRGMGGLGALPLAQVSLGSRGKFASMEGLITHFRLNSEGWPTAAGFAYSAVESPKGEVGVTLVSDGTPKPHRLKLRTPVSHNMHLLPTLSVGSIFADFVATFCSLDIVLGEIDR